MSLLHLLARNPHVHPPSPTYGPHLRCSCTCGRSVATSLRGLTTTFHDEMRPRRWESFEVALPESKFHDLCRAPTSSRLYSTCTQYKQLWQQSGHWFDASCLGPCTHAARYPITLLVEQETCHMQQVIILLSLLTLSAPGFRPWQGLIGKITLRQHRNVLF